MSKIKIKLFISSRNEFIYFDVPKTQKIDKLKLLICSTYNFDPKITKIFYKSINIETIKNRSIGQVCPEDTLILTLNNILEEGNYSPGRKQNKNSPSKMNILNNNMKQNNSLGKLLYCIICYYIYINSFIYQLGIKPMSKQEQLIMSRIRSLTSSPKKGLEKLEREKLNNNYEYGYDEVYYRDNRDLLNERRELDELDDIYYRQRDRDRYLDRRVLDDVNYRDRYLDRRLLNEDLCK